MQYPKLYIDANDVERGYYVYAHVCKNSKRVFYIGKGKEERAWSDARSNAWTAFVQGLEMGYEVVLLHKDLTEIESIDLERFEIEANGGASSQGGSLINWIPGEAGHGFGVAAVVEISVASEQTFDQKAVNERCYQSSIDARKYKKLSVEQKRQLGISFKEAVGGVFEPIESMYLEIADGNRESIFLIETAYRHYMEVCTLCRQLKNKKITYAWFCEQTDNQVESYARSVQKDLDSSGLDPSMKQSCKRLAEMQIEWTRAYSEGTFDEAHEAHDREWIKYRFPPYEQYDRDFEQYVAITRSVFGNGRAESVRKLRQALGAN